MEIIREMVFGMVGLFLQPLFYIFLLFSAFISFRRVKLERRDFHVRVYSASEGIVESIVPGLFSGLAGSIVLLGVGMVLPKGMILFIAALYLLAVLTLQLKFVSPAFTVGLAVLFVYFFPDVHTGVDVLDQWIGGVREAPLAAAALLLGLLLVLEGMIIGIWGKRTTPRLLRGKRGKTVGAHEARKFWIVPLFLLLPEGVIPDTGLWPLTGTGDGYSLLLVPFGFGFYRLITDVSPKQAVSAAAKQSIWGGMAVLVLAGACLYSGMEFFAVAAALLAVIWKTAAFIGGRFRRENSPMYFRQRDDGLMVLGVLPDSPAEKLGIRVGECIHKVNGLQVHREGDFYQGLQRNGAFCKMEVVNEAGEVRFVQGALYEGAHHELGLLFVATPKSVS